MATPARALGAGPHYRREVKGHPLGALGRWGMRYLSAWAASHVPVLPAASLRAVVDPRQREERAEPERARLTIRRVAAPPRRAGDGGGVHKLARRAGRSGPWYQAQPRRC